jgi:hypothetical protein
VEMCPCGHKRPFPPHQGFQVVVDHRGLILDLVARWPGSTRDRVRVSFVWARSAGGEEVDRWVWPECSPLGQWLPPPNLLYDPCYHSAKHSNAPHIQTRLIVERTIGRPGRPAHSAGDLSLPCRRVLRRAIHFFPVSIRFCGRQSPSWLFPLACYWRV